MNKGIEGTVTVTQRPHLHEGDAAGCSECVVKLCAVSALLFGAGGVFTTQLSPRDLWSESEGSRKGSHP